MAWESEQRDGSSLGEVCGLGHELTGDVTQQSGRSDRMAAVPREELDQAGTVLQFGQVAVEIEPVEGLELKGDVALEKIADIRWRIHATRVARSWQRAIPSKRQGAYSSSASNRPLRSKRCIRPDPVWSV